MTTVLPSFGALSFDDPFNMPFFTGGTPEGTSLVPKVLPVSIAGHAYAVDFEKYRRTTMQIRRLQTDDSVEPGENSLNATGLWPRAQDNFFLGAGQLFLDNRFAYESVYVHSGEYPSVRTRFWRSKGVNPWLEGRLSLQAEQAKKKTSSNGNLFLVATGTALYASDGTDVYWSTNPTAGSPTWTSSGIGGHLGSAITGLATDGHRVWACDGAHGIAYSDDQGTTATLLTGSYHATNLWYSKGFLIATTNRDLATIASDGTDTNIWTHPSTNFIWTTIDDTPSCILVGGNAGSVSFIGSMQADAATEGATLAVPFTATTLPPGETINDLAYSAGFVLLATSQGIRSGTRPDSSGVFDINPVIQDPGNCLCIAPWQKFCYFGWTEYTTEDDEVFSSGVTSSGLGRADLSQYTNPGVPAYATDIMAEDGTTAAVISIAILNGVPYFSLAHEGIYGPTGNVVDKGSFQVGWVRYGTLESKILCSSQPFHAPLLEGQSILTQVSDQSANVTTLGSSNTVGSVTTNGPFGGNLLVGMKFMPIMTLNRGTDATQGPVLHAWIDKSMVVPPRQDEIICPILLHTKQATLKRDGHPMTFDTLAEFKFLKQLETSGQAILYQEGALSINCYIDQVQMAPDGMNQMIHDEDVWFEGICTVKLITLVLSNG